MSIAGILSSSLVGLFNDSQSIQNKKQQFQQEFQQLGQDLQSGNLSAAQTDFASLQQLRPQTNSTASRTSRQNNSPSAQAFKQLSTDLQAGNVTGAQQDYARIQQDFLNQGAKGNHQHAGGGSGANGISQSLEQLAQALQSGNLASAQQAYTTLQQDFQQAAQTNGLQAPGNDAVGFE